MKKNIYYDIKYIKLAYDYANKHSKCLRRKVGAVLVPHNDKNIILSTNIPVPDSLQCIKEGCIRDHSHILSGQHTNICRCVHAEVDLILQCALHNISPINSTVYCTLSPCASCARILSKAQIRRLVFCEDYPDSEFISIFQSSNIEFEKIDYKS